QHSPRSTPRRRPNAAVRTQMREDRRGCLAEHPANQLQSLTTLPAIPDLRALRCREEAPLSLLAHLPPHLSIEGKVLRQSPESTTRNGHLPRSSFPRTREPR